MTDTEATLSMLHARLALLLAPDVARRHSPHWNDALLEVRRWLEGESMDPELAETVRRCMEQPERVR
jgi:hypothetical protein